MELSEQSRAALSLIMAFVSLLLYLVWRSWDQRFELWDKLKSKIISGLKELVKAACRLLFAVVYFHLFIVILLVMVWPNIRSFFETVLQGQTSWQLTLILKNSLLILLSGALVLALFEGFLKIIFKKDEEDVFRTIGWLGNTTLALIGALSIYYAVYPNGINATVTEECLCAKKTLAQSANRYLWSEAFLMFFGLGILDFYKVIRCFDQEKKYMCQNSGCEIVLVKPDAGHHEKSIESIEVSGDVKVVSDNESEGTPVPDIVDDTIQKADDTGESKIYIVVVAEKHGPVGGSGNPLEEAGNSCLPTSPSALHRDDRSRRRRTEPFSSGKRRSYRASAERTWRRRQRGSAASAADVQQTTGFQEPPAGPAL